MDSAGPPQRPGGGGPPDPYMRRVLVGVTISQLLLAFLAVGLRVFARYRSEMKFGADDWCIIAAVITIIPFGVAIFVSERGKQTGNVANLELFFQTFVLEIVSYSISTSLVKISILCFYCRIFASRKLKHIAWCVGVFVVLYNSITIAFGPTLCDPLLRLWKGKQAKCLDTSVPFPLLGSINFVTDIVVLAIPVHFVRRLHTNLLRKIQIIGIFLTGAVVCIFSIVRVVALIRAQNADSQRPNSTSAWPSVWSICEACVGIFAACLPTLGFYFSQTLTINRDGKIWAICSRVRSWTRPKSSSRKESLHSDSDRHFQRSASEKTVVTPSTSGIQKTIDVNISSLSMDRELARIDQMSISGPWDDDSEKRRSIVR